MGALDLNSLILRGYSKAPYLSITMVAYISTLAVTESSYDKNTNNIIWPSETLVLFVSTIILFSPVQLDKANKESEEPSISETKPIENEKIL